MLSAPYPGVLHTQELSRLPVYPWLLEGGQWITDISRHRYQEASGPRELTNTKSPEAFVDKDRTLCTHHRWCRCEFHLTFIQSARQILVDLEEALGGSIQFLVSLRLLPCCQ